MVLGMGAIVLSTAAGAQADPPDPAQDTAPQAARYQIHSEYDQDAGDAYRWSSNEYVRTTITRGDADPAGGGEGLDVESDTYLKYGILANSYVESVEEVDSGRRTLAVTHIIERLYLMEDDLLEPGTVVVATRGEGETIYTIGDDRIENETLLYVLDKFAELHDDAPDGLEAAMRIPDTPQPVGARWEIDGPAYFGALFELEEPPTPTEASGEIHLAAAEDVFGYPGLRLELQFLYDGVPAAAAASRPGSELLSSVGLMEGEMRIAQAEGRIESGLEMQLRITQRWRDPDQEPSEYSVVIYSELSMGQRELTQRERELLGFDE